LKVLTSLTYSPNTVEIKEYDSKGNQERIEKFVFERNRIPNLFTGKDFVGNRVSSWKYEFKNKFNDNDQLIWRKNKNTGEITKFTYNEKGLLIRMTTTINIGGHISKETTVFTYKYFKKK
jgi:YD repeat-containing protein